MIEFMVQFQGAKTFSFGTVAIRQATLNNNAGTSNALCEQLTTLCGHGLLKEALYILRGTDHKHLRLSCFTYASLLQLCLDKRSLPGAKRVHTHLTETGFTTNIYLAHKLVVLYAKLGSLQDARLVLDDMEAMELFETMPERNVYSWSVMVTAYAQAMHRIGSFVKP
ncbi:hypothetical protein SUGI_0341780 [Cryptomeria japonica]|nr:hypothetical protein SUGI_0341780 [Cryptomeria japonica]